jgi:FtsZ-binding cell division protein ZapB
MNINLDKIVIDAGTQARAKIDQELVAEYTDLLKQGTVFDPVTLFYDGAQYFLADGFHRYFANRKAGSPNINANTIEGTLRDAILFSFSANSKHGRRPNAADRRKAVTTMLNDIEWQDYSDREIARICDVSHTLVATIRKELNATKVDTKYVRDGKQQTMKPKADDKSYKEEQFDAAAIDAEIQKAATENLQKENEDLRDQLTVAMAASTDDVEKEKAQSIIKDLRAQIRLLEIELKAVTTSRDQFQRENAQLMKQVAMWQKKLNKLEGK